MRLVRRERDVLPLVQVRGGNILRWTTWLRFGDRGAKRRTLNSWLFWLSPRILKISDAALIATIDWKRWNQGRKLESHPGRFIGQMVHLDGKVRLIAQPASKTVRGELVPHVQPVLNEVIAELFVQGFLSVHVVSDSHEGSTTAFPYVFCNQGIVRGFLGITQSHDQLVTGF